MKTVSFTVFMLFFVLFVATGPPVIAQTLFVESGASKGILPNKVARHPAPIGGVFAADYDNDGDVDLFVPNDRGFPNQLYENVGGGMFSEIAALVGVEDTMEQDRAALFFDYDGDHDMDLIVASDCRRLYGPDPCLFPVSLRLHQQQIDGTFLDVSAAAGFGTALTSLENQHIGGIVAGDVNNDNYLDVLIVTWGGVAYLFLNNTDGTFSEVAAVAGLPTANLQHQSAIMGDFNNDGWLDIFLSIDIDTPNQMLMNRTRTLAGVPQFEDIGVAAGIADEFNDMGVALGDFDNDELLDIYVSNIAISQVGETVEWNVLYHKLSDNPPRYEEVAREAGVDWGWWSWGTTFLDMDNDTDVDIAVANGAHFPVNWSDPSLVWENTMTGDPIAFNDVSAAVGYDDTYVTSGLVGFDHDYDGDVDLFQVAAHSNFPAPITAFYLNVYDNTAPTNPNYLIVKPRMAGANHWAIGTRIRAELANGTVMTKYVTAGMSTLGQEPSELHFGLGTDTQVQALDLLFPNGARESLQNVPGNQVITVNCTSADVANSLRLERSGGDVILRWSASCAGDATEDYEVLAEDFGLWNSPAPVLASTAGQQHAVVTPNAGNRFYLVETAGP